MRTRKLTLCTLAAIAAMATACSNDQLNDIDNKKGIVIKATAGTPQEGADTRLTHNDQTTRMDIVWAADDAFTVYESSSNKTDYTIDANDAGKASASFTGTWDTEPTSEKVYAIYPSQTTNNPTSIFLSLNNQTGKLEGLKDFNYMTSSADYVSGQSLNFKFKHQVAIVKLVMTFPDGVTGDASNVGLSATGLNNNSFLNLTTGAFRLAASDNVTANDPIAIGTNQPLTAYLCVFPGALTNAKVVANVGIDHYEAQLANLNIVAGNMYTATVNMTTTKITWAVGNLVANGPNGAKIGAPTDGGLYFQFGSLIGWAGGATGDGKGTPSSDVALALKVSPTNYSGNTSWNSSWTGDPTTDDASTGTGDPCRYYLKDTWRLPTADEYRALFNSTTTDWAGSGGWSWTDNSAKHKTNGLIFPASGYRYNFDGPLQKVNSTGSYWSSSPNNTAFGYYLEFDNGSARPSSTDSRASGLPVRCVQPATNQPTP